MFLKKSLAVIMISLISASLYNPLVQAKEFKVKCDSLKDCMAKGDKLTKRRKLSLAVEAYRNAIKMDVNNKDAWRKFEKITVRISEEGGC